MPAYLVQMDAERVGATLHGPCSAMVVFAADAADARAVVKAQIDGDSDGHWDDATVTEIATPASEWEGWRFQIVVSDPATLDIVANVTVTGDATDDTIDEIGAALATALNATASIANAAYNSTTQVLTVASGSGGDDLGDHDVKAYVYPPSPAGDVSLPGVVSSITDEGAATDALSVTYAADGYVVPSVPVQIIPS